MFKDCKNKINQGGLVATASVTFAAIIAPTLLNSEASAAPQGSEVKAGEAEVTALDSKTVQIRQSSKRAVIDWRSFDMDADESTIFVQPDKDAIALNRVRSDTASNIAGKLSANGNVIIVNTNGVYFSKTAQVDVNSLMVSTADTDTAHFMSGGKIEFNKPGKTEAKIVNEGTITARQAGLVGFVAPHIENTGHISATKGRIQLAAGDTSTLDLYGDGLMEIAVSDEIDKLEISNSGSLTANGGEIKLTAVQGRAVLDSLIDVDGHVVAATQDNETGKVTIRAATNKTTDRKASRVVVRGVVDVSGEASGQRAGKIDISGDQIALLSNSHLKANGDIKGGSIRIGGDYAGQTNGMELAQQVIMQSNAIITANGLSGDYASGGRVILWSEYATRFAGLIEAKGSRTNGDGGFVETSSRSILEAIGQVDASASARGKAGQWLLDPNNITISTGANANISGNPDFTTSNNSAVLSAASIVSALNNSTSVTVATGTAGANSQSGDIAVNTSITKTAGSAASLTLKAHNNISFATNAVISSTSGALNVTINSDSDASGAGSILMNLNTGILSNGGNIILGGGLDPTTTAAIGSGANARGVNLNKATLNAAGGNISIRGIGLASGTSRDGVIFQGGSVVRTTGNGTITIVGNAGTGTATTNNRGVYLTSANTVVAAQNGAINITGTGGGTTSGNEGIYVTVGAVIQSEGSGAINLTGHAGGTTALGIYLNQTTATNTITSEGGDVTLRSNQSIQLTRANIISNTAAQFNLLVNSDLDASGAGRIYFATSSATTNGGNITLGGGAAPLTTSARGHAGNIEGINLNASTLNAGGGDISLRGQGHNGTTNNHGVILQAASQVKTSGAGEINIYGTGGNGTSGNRGIYLTAASTYIESEDGSINLTGTSGGSTSTNNGIYLTAGGNLLSTGMGDIMLTGHASGTTTQGIWINQSSPVNTITTAGGNVSLYSNSTIQLNSAVFSSTTATAYDILINADRDEVSGGTISISGSSLLSYGGDIILGGGASPLTTAASAVSTSIAYGIQIIGASLLDAAGGDIYINGRGNNLTTNNYGVTIQAGSRIQTSNDGDITITGQGGNGSGTGNRGVYITGAGSAVSAGNGSITITGTGGSSNTSSYGIDLSSGAAITASGNAAINLTAQISGGSNTAFYNNAVAASLGGAGYTGDITLTANNLTWGATSATTAGRFTVMPYAASTSIGVSGASGNLAISAAMLATIAADSGLIIGRLDGTGALRVNTTTWAKDATLRNGTGDIFIQGTQTMGANRFTAITEGAGADITIDTSGAITSMASSTAVTISADGHFYNNSSLAAGALTAINGRWLIYSPDISSQTLNGLSASFRRFSCSYGASCPTIPSSGNGLLYANTPTLTVTPATINLQYGDSLSAASNYGYVVSGYLGSDSSADTVSGSLAGTSSYTPTSNVGIYNLNYSSGSLTSLMGYGFTYANNATAVHVSKRPITASIPTKTIFYGQRTPTLAKTSISDVLWNGLVNGNSGADLDSVTFDYGGLIPGSVSDVGSYALTILSLLDNNYQLTGVTSGLLNIERLSRTASSEQPLTGNNNIGIGGQAIYDRLAFFGVSMPDWLANYAANQDIFIIQADQSLQRAVKDFANGQNCGQDQLCLN
jgi:filamentous hemagglutinin family protein